jgi:hypothetical protein
VDWTRTGVIAAVVELKFGRLEQVHGNDDDLSPFRGLLI